MTNNDTKIAIVAMICLFLCCTLLFVLFGWFSHTEELKRLETEAAIEINKNNETIEVLDKTKDSLMLQVDNINTIKDAEIIKVKSLDNDSTLNLFYQLIRK